VVRRPSEIFQLAHSGQDVMLSPMNLGDLDPVIEIEAVCFPTPWSRDMFLAELSSEHPWAVIELVRPVDSGTAARGSRKAGSTFIDDAEVSTVSPIIGYVDYWLVYDEVHLLSIAVVPQWRRRGLGRILLDRPISAGLLGDCAHVVLEVRRGNLPAQRLYESAGFRPVGLRKRYYSDTGEDAIVMMKILPSHSNEEEDDDETGRQDEVRKK